jgi:hypothetical protein
MADRQAALAAALDGLAWRRPGPGRGHVGSTTARTRRSARRRQAGDLGC